MNKTTSDLGAVWVKTARWKVVLKCKRGLDLRLVNFLKANLSNTFLGDFITLDWQKRAYRKTIRSLRLHSLFFRVRLPLKYLPIVYRTKSQLGQEIVALASAYHRSAKSRRAQSLRRLCYLEIGAADGVEGSNSMVLESSHGWEGVLVEPAREWQESLIRNRRASVIPKAAHSKSGVNLWVNFKGLLTEVSKSKDMPGVYKVETISLEDIIQTTNLPNHVDYLSIDTEGSELEILGSLDYSHYLFFFISVEHNFDAIKREGIRTLLSDNGYRRILMKVSSFDDWYVKVGSCPTLERL